MMITSLYSLSEPLTRAGSLHAHRRRSLSQYLRCLAGVQIKPFEQYQCFSLTDRQISQGATKEVPFIRSDQGVRGLPFGSVEHASRRETEPTKTAAMEIDCDSVRVAGRVVGLADFPPSLIDPQACLLRQVFGFMTVSGNEEHGPKEALVVFAEEVLKRPL
jgi:hypothetical protein